MRRVAWPGRETMLFGVAVALIALCAAGRVWLIPAHVSFNANEGWNAFQAVRALGAGPLYPPPGALTGDNYPPLSFYLVGWAGRPMGDPIVAGRIIALGSVLAVSAGVYAVVRRILGSGGRAPAIAALMLLAFAATQFRTYLAMDDPQWLAHALMTAGLLILVPPRSGEAPPALSVAAAALLMILGGLVKHNLLAFPLAATAWLALHHRRALGVWLVTSAAALAACAALALQLYGPDIFPDLIAGDRHLSGVRMAVKSAPVLAAAAPLTGVATLLVRDRRGDTRLDLVLLAAAIGVPLGVLQRAGQGVSVNAHFEALIALCIAAGVALGRGEGRALTPVVRRPLPWLLAPFVVLAPLALLADAREVAGRAPAQASWRAMEARIAATPGPVACETAALCFWAGKPFALDVFLYGQHAARSGDASLLLRALDHHDSPPSSWTPRAWNEAAAARCAIPCRR